MPAQSRLLDRVDVISFHTYGHAAEMESLVGKYRGWLREHDAGSMPLWITECGRPWKKGPERPPLEEDAVSALDITMKGVEARACGIARYFPFVYPYFEENANNFGMMDRRATPLRSVAAYAQMIRALGRQAYMGDLKQDAPGLVRARLFGDDRQAIAVLYTSRPDPLAVLKLDLPATRIEGIDGRPLKPAAPDTIPIPDGLTYVWLDRAKLGDRLQADTPARRLHADTAKTHKRTSSPIVLRYQFDPARVQPSAKGYRLKGTAPAGTMPFVVRAFNLSGQPVSVHLVLNVEGGETPAIGPPADLTIRAQSHADATWTVDPAGLLSKKGRATLIVSASDSSGLRDRTAVVLEGEPDLKQILGQHPQATRLPIQDRKRWSPNISGHGQMTMDSTAEASWRLNVQQVEAIDRWVYPNFQLPDDVHLVHARGLIVRVRCDRGAQVRVFLWEGNSGVGYITADPIIPPDGQWHVAVLNFADLIPSSANAPDPNHRLDLDTVRRLSIGMNQRQDENTLEVSDLYVLGE